MNEIVFQLKVFRRGESDRLHSENALLALLNALVLINISWLRSNPKTPLLYKSGVRYRREMPSENWRDIPTILDNGNGDCEDLACWRAAELAVMGKRAKIGIKHRKIGGHYLYHIIVLRPGGKVEDPSRVLGME